MRHIVFFIHILSLMLGCITVVLSVFSYSKFKSRLIKHYSFFLISLLAILSERMITYYMIASNLNGQYINIIFWVISCLGSGLLLYSLPILIHDVLGLNISEGKRIIFNLLGYLPIISLLLYYTLPYKTTILNIIDLIICVLELYCLCLAIVNFKFVKTPEARKIIKTFLIIFIVWQPATIIDLRLQEVLAFQRIFPYGLLSIPVFYLIWNSLSLYFGYKYLGSSIFSPVNEQNEPGGETPEEGGLENSFFDKYKITNREREVIQLLLKGYSYKRISEELVISFTTARTHVYNIYQKTGAKNKIELANLMKENTNNSADEYIS